jgi:DNA polymerase-3 subunit gamma/tau
MLRTHGELGYRQDQRFHLELGLLKMAHAQRLLPLEQLLSDVAPASGATPRTGGRPVLTAPSEVRRAEPQAPPRSNYVSPFAADSARKNTPKAEAVSETAGGAARSASFSGTVVIMGSAAPAVAEIDSEPQAAAKNEINSDFLRDVVLNALNAQPMLVSMLEAGQWSLEGNSLVARVALSSTMIDMSFTADARRIASAAASGAAGRPVKMQVLPGGMAQAASLARRPSSNGSARSRAEQDPVVRSMQEKFGAEIRTVIDYREKS